MSAWREGIVELLGVPTNLGTDEPGIDLGPAALRRAGLLWRLRRLGVSVEDGGDVAPEGPLEPPSPRRRWLTEIVLRSKRLETEVAPEERVHLERIREACAALGLPPEEARFKRGKQIVEHARRLRDRVRAAVERGRFPFLIGGDHSLTVGAVAGLRAADPSARLGLIWIDAHADFNTPLTSPSGNPHGMSVAALCGHGAEIFAEHGAEGWVDLAGTVPAVRPEDVVYIGLRDVDPEEREVVRTLEERGMQVYDMWAVARRGALELLEEAMARLEARVDRVYVSFDLDALDPSFAPGVSTPVPSPPDRPLGERGLRFWEAALLLQRLGAWEKVAAFDLVELNPMLDAANLTGRVAVDLIASFFGERALSPVVYETVPVRGVVR